MPFGLWGPQVWRPHAVHPPSHFLLRPAGSFWGPVPPLRCLSSCPLLRGVPWSHQVFTLLPRGLPSP